MMRAWPYLAALAAFIVSLLMAYGHGVDVTTDRYELRLAKASDVASRAIADAGDKMRKRDAQAADEMAALDQKHQLEIQNEITSRERIIADLRSGAIGLRARFTCPATGGSLPIAATGTSRNHDAKAFGLQNADAEFLVRLASEADEIANQLRTCQAIVRADRAAKP